MNYKIIISKIVFVAFIVVFMISGCGENEPQLVDLSQQSNSEKYIDDSEEGREDDVTGAVNETKSDEVTICVHISGAVVEPGLYELSEGSRLYDAVMAAGGFTNDAAVDYSNLAEVLLDGVKYHIYTESEIEEIKTVEEVSGGQGALNTTSHYNSVGQLNINLATKEELMKLSGIGEAKAQSIIDYREENGAFKSIDDLKNVSGIGEGLFTKISGDIIVN